MEKLTPILPCTTRDNASEPRSAAQADELLSAWTALWHPAVIAAAGVMPKWHPAGEPPDDPAGHLLVIPPAAEPLLPPDWLSHAEARGAKMIRGKRTRAEMVASAVEMLGVKSAVDKELAADFLALGYCHYVIETITVRIRYMNSLDETAFEKELVAAAVAACGGEGETGGSNLSEARARLQAAFDLLHTAREYYYSAESHLLDLTLVAGTTIGQSLRAMLARGAAAGHLRSGSAAVLAGETPARHAANDPPSNLLFSAEVLEQMAEREPESLAALRQAAQENAVTIIGGEYRELELPLLPIEAVRGQLSEGLAIYDKLLAERPKVFGRRRFGMTPMLPQILEQLGFSGAVHATLDDGRFPTSNTSRQRWEGLDGTTIEALLRVPIDAAKADGFVRLPHVLSGATDMDNQPTAILAHWPGLTSSWNEDIRRARRYTSVLGAFRSLPDYFEHTGVSGHQIEFKADEYRSPYLVQAVAAGEEDPISRWQREYADRAATEATETINALAWVAAGNVTEGDLAAAVGARSTAFRRNDASDDRPKPGLQPPAGLMVINPLSFSRRVRVDVADLAAPPDIGGAVLQVGGAAGRKTAIVEVPPLGFATIRPGTGKSATGPRRGFSFFRKSQSKPIAEKDSKQGGATLRNEFFEAVIDPHLGAIRAVYDFHSRGPRLAQQLAMRLSGGDEDDAYTIMAADEIRVVDSGPIVGEVAVRGRLVDRAGQVAAEFRQTTRVTWGSRVIEVEVEIDPCRALEADPWNSYIAARFAWAQDTPTIYRSVNQATVTSELTRLEAPQFVEVRGQSGRTTILTAGLPYHRRNGFRKLDSLLVVRGEAARKFRFGIGIDLPQPQAAALDFIAPVVSVPLESLPKNDSAWLYHLDNRAVVATHWEPIIEQGEVAGVRVRLLETEGRHVSLGLRSFRAVKSACKTGGGEREAVDLAIAGDTITVPLRPYEWAEVEVR
jgi:alpha-mannosidase